MPPRSRCVPARERHARALAIDAHLAAAARDLVRARNRDGDGRARRRKVEELERAVIARVDEGIVDGRVEATAGALAGLDGRLDELEQVGADASPLPAR